MLAIHENEIIGLKKVSIRYDNSTRTYYCFYHRKDDLLSEVILSYEIDADKWIVDTVEFKDIFEKKLNELFHEEKIPFEEQIPHVIDYLDTYFADQSEQKKIKVNVINHRIYSFSWFRRLRGIRRWASQDVLTGQSPILQRYSAPEKSTHMDQIISVKTLAESFYTDGSPRSRTKTVSSPLEYPEEYISTRIPNKAPPITEIWLNVVTKEMNEFRGKIGNRTEEEKLKKLAEKFVTYFGGTFQCNVGQEYQLEYDCQTWHFIVLKVALLTNKISEISKLPKTKIIFIINGIPHYVRG